jgi:glyceraldehyde 3-phosphate dehydrogenase
MIKVAINGFGRTGRQAFKSAFERHKDKIQFVAINDLGKPEHLAHLLKYDSTYGVWNKEVDFEGQNLIINGQKIPVFSERDAEKLPWKDLDVDIVIDCTGFYTKREMAEKHLRSGAKKVIISAPAENPDITIVLGVNEEKYNPEKHQIISNDSCTTNCLAPVLKVINEKFGVRKGFMSTVHSYTMDQRIQDNDHEDLRRARGAAVNIIPTKTGAAKAIFEVIEGMEGKLDGLAWRVPTSTVSVIDCTFLLDKETTVEKINEAFKEAKEGRMKGILDIVFTPVVSSDFRGSPFSSIVDGLLTKVLDKNLAHIVSWYDNEWGYSTRLGDLAVYIGNQIK